MRRIAALLTLLLLMPVAVHAATTATATGRASGGARAGRVGGGAAIAPRLPGAGIPRIGIPRGEIPGLRFPRTGIRRRGFRTGIGTGLIVGAPLLEPIEPLWPWYDTLGYGYAGPELALPYNAYVPPPDIYVPPVSGYAAPPGAAVSQQIWYYCRDPMGFYPYVQNCNTDWQSVPASVLPPPTPQ